MNNGFDYITSGNYAGDWLQIQFLAETVATLTPHTGDSVTGTFAAGQQLVGTFVEVNVTSGVMLAYRRGATAKRSLTDADFQAVLNRGTTLGYSLPTGTALTAGDTLVKSLKSAGIWNKLDIFYVFATNGDSDFATLNWKTPASFQATKVNSPTFTANEGFQTNGTTNYLNTNWSPATNGVNYQLNSASAGVYVRSSIDVSGGSALWGSRDAGTTDLSYETTDTAAFLNSNFTGAAAFANNVLAGFRHLNRANSTQLSRIVNGVTQTVAQNSQDRPNAIFYLGCFNNNGSAAGFEANQYSIFFAGASLASEASDFFIAIEAYMDAIGKGVVA